MAVKPKKIKERLLELFPKLKNLSRSRMNKLTVALGKIPADDAEDDAIDEVINDYNTVFSFEEIAQQDDSLRTMKKKLDDAGKTQDSEEEEEEEEEEETQKGKGKEKSSPNNKIESLLEKMSDKMDGFSKELDSMKSGKIIEGKQESAMKLFAESDVLKKLPKAMQKRLLRTIDFEGDETLEDQIAELEEENQEFLQDFKDGEDLADTPPVDTGGVKVDDALVDDVVDDL